MDFINDYNQLILAEINVLISDGFIFPTFQEYQRQDPSATNTQYESFLIHLYYNLKSKIPSAKRRIVHKCSSFVVPPQYQAGINMIEDEIKNGKELWPRLSRQIFKADFCDMMMFDFGICHLHLGINNDVNYPALIQGTSDILYVMFTEEEAIFVRIDKHGLWNDRKLLEEIDTDFPDVLQPYVTTGTPLERYTDEDRLKLKKMNVNTGIDIHGKNIMPPGMGMNGAGMSVNSTIAIVKTRHFLQEIQNNIKRVIEEKFKSFEDIDCHLTKIDQNRAEIFDENNRLLFVYDMQKASITYQQLNT